MKRFCKKTWSPWVCGAILGVLAVASVVLIDDRLGASGGFQSIASAIVNALGLENVGELYFTVVKPPAPDPQVVLFAGMIVGAFLAALSARDFRIRHLPEERWVERFGTSRAKRWAFVFSGAFLLQLGAGMAGGCTSGLGVSGTMQLAPSGIAFIVGCFAAGIAVAAILYAGRGE